MAGCFMSKKLKGIVIPKENAAFWLDRFGRWHSEYGRFENRKIIAHFHASIRKDRNGYHVAQTYRGIREKVYFPYEDTALFAFGVVKGEHVTLLLNTGRRMKLKPRRLFIREDSLYMWLGEERIKFIEHALIRIAPLLEYEGTQCFIRAKGRRYRIPEV
jgi:hypothetical protein